MVRSSSPRESNVVPEACPNNRDGTRGGKDTRSGIAEWPEKGRICLGGEACVIRSTRSRRRGWGREISSMRSGCASWWWGQSSGKTAAQYKIGNKPGKRGSIAHCTSDFWDKKTYYGRRRKVRRRLDKRSGEKRRYPILCPNPFNVEGKMERKMHLPRRREADRARRKGNRIAVRDLGEEKGKSNERCDRNQGSANVLCETKLAEDPSDGSKAKKTPKGGEVGDAAKHLLLRHPTDHPQGGKKRRSPDRSARGARPRAGQRNKGLRKGDTSQYPNRGANRGGGGANPRAISFRS